MNEPFRGSESGLTRQRLRGRRYQRLHRDVFVLTPVAQSLALRVDALLAALPDAIASHHTAARLMALPVDDDRLLHITRPPTAGVCERPGVRTHRRHLPPAAVFELHGRPLTRPEATFVDLGPVLSHVDLVVLADAVARRVGLSRLQERVHLAAGARGIRAARAALALADPGSDSPAETKTRLILHAAGFTALRHRVDVSDCGGGWLARPDLADPGARVAVQYDGLIHLSGNPEQRRADIDRDELLRQHGWQVVVLTAFDLRDPQRMIDKVAAAYARARRL